MNVDKVNELHAKINSLIREMMMEIDPSPVEIAEAYEALTDDPINNIHEILDVDTTTGMLLLCDEVVCRREMKEEEEESNG